ncbi:MAG: hypothetical protein ABEJ95_04030 [Candidatus Nanohalobium sp.]
MVDNGSSVRGAFRDSLKLWRSLLGLTALTVLLAFLNSLPFSLGLTAYLSTGDSFWVLLGGGVSLVSLVAIGFALYFVPVTLLKKKDLMESLQDSFSVSRRNRGEVLGLTVFSILVLSAASLTTGYLRDLGLAVFYIGRVVSSVVGTYVLVVSPSYYLHGEDT